jgi:amino acid transporter
MTGDTLSATPGGAPHLRRVLALRDLIVVASASMAPAFSVATSMPSMLVAAGRWTWIALVLITVVMAMTAVGYKRLGERMRDAGSSYAWIRVAFGPEAGAYAAWVLLIANLFAVLATALPAGVLTLELLGFDPAKNALAVALVGCAWILGTAVLLWYGLRPTALLTFALLAGEIVVLGAAAGVAVGHPRSDAVAFAPVPFSWGGIAAAMAIGIWMLDGWEVAASTSEEAGGGPEVPGSGGLAGLAVTSIVLLAATWAFARIGSAAEFAKHDTDGLAYIGGLLGGWWRPVLDLTLLASLAAALQTTLVYLTRSIYAMGRDGLLARRLGALDRRGEPAAAIVLITGLSLAAALATGFSPSAKAGFDFARDGTLWFLGLLFLMSAGAAVRVFAAEASARWTGVVLPGTATVALAGILGLALRSDDPNTRGFIAASAIIGLPLALWRGRAVRRAFVPGAEPRTGSRF